MNNDSNKPETLRMEADNPGAFLERIYRESGEYQWVRELFFNGREAGADRIEFGLEPQAMKNGLYRRTIADNGCGMGREELRKFCNTLGGGGKPIGGHHENFGVGGKISLLPWNHHGVAVVSWVDGVANMIWMHRDSSGEYGLKKFAGFDAYVVEPFDDPVYGCNWAEVKPAWIEDHGTVIILLGNDPAEHTAYGDPGRDESTTKGISRYLNTRIWEIPSEVVVNVNELRSLKPDPAKPCSMRRIHGARHHIETPLKDGRGGLAHSGTVTLGCGVEIVWHLWEGERPALRDSAAEAGFVATLYENELYGMTNHASTYRSFGICDGSVRKNLWLVIRPPAYDAASNYGIFPNTARNDLLLHDGHGDGKKLPINDWGSEFVDRMPEEIQQALRAAREGVSGSLDDPLYKKRLADKFGARWKVRRRRVRTGGSTTVEPGEGGAKPGKGGGGKGKSSTRTRRGGLSTGRTAGSNPGTEPAEVIELDGGLPDYLYVKAEDVEPGMLAAWQSAHPSYPNGVILINREHSHIEGQVKYWQDQYADHQAEEVGLVVEAVYGETAVAKLAHTEQFRKELGDRVDTELRSPGALMTALLGLLAEDAVIINRLKGRFRRRLAG